MFIFNILCFLVLSDISNFNILLLLYGHIHKFILLIKNFAYMKSKIIIKILYSLINLNYLLKTKNLPSILNAYIFDVIRFYTMIKIHSNRF